MKPLALDAQQRAAQQKGTDTAQKAVPGAFSLSGGAPNIAARAAKAAGNAIAASVLAPNLEKLRAGSMAPSALSPAGSPSQEARARIVDMLASLRLPGTEQNILAVHALMSEGLLLTSKAVSSLSRIQRKFPGEETLASRLAARALAAGIDPESADMDSLWDVFSISGDENGSRGDASGGRDGHQADDRRRAETGKSPESEFAANQVEAEGEAAANLAGSLASLLVDAMNSDLMRSLAKPNTLNRAWIYVPFSFPLENIEFSGVFRILYNHASGKTECMVADIRSGARKRLFCVSGAGAAMKLQFASDLPAEAAAVVASLAARGMSVRLGGTVDALDEEIMRLPVALDAHV